MHRREALKNVAVLFGGVISATTMGVLFESFTLPENEKNRVFFNANQEKILAEFAEIIIPTTKSAPGAKAAGVGKFIPMMVRDCYPASIQQAFFDGLKQMESKSFKDFNKAFLSLTSAERTKLVGEIRDETIQLKQADKAANKKESYFFIIARDLTILGYFSSEIGCVQARNYVAIPGRYDGAAPLKPGQKSWAT
ncbi:MAG: gluconate 2-dehydrogenase subunit 3 family protein [Pedobacter sp.]|nr:gluconate 2-dehydrogenase subunit 3 family protein [Pedobacter sp.]